MRSTSIWLPMPPSPASPTTNKYSWVVTNPGTKPMKAGADCLRKDVLGSGATRRNTWTVTIQECQLHLVHSDLTALITGPNAGNFPYYSRRRPIFTRIPPRLIGDNRIANSPSSITRPAISCRRFANGAITISST